PLPLPVERAAVEHYVEALEWGDVGYLAWLKRKEEVRAKFARLIGAKPGEVAFTQSTSMGFNIVARMMRARGVRTVVTLAEEFPSTTVPFLNLGFKLK